MILSPLHIELEQHWVTFRKAGAGNAILGFRLDNQMNMDDVVAAACATGWVVCHDGRYWVGDSVDCEALSEYVNEMLFYFVRSGEPRKELLRLVDPITRYWNESRQRQALSLWACAYLDLAVREDLAEQTSQVENLWCEPFVELEVERHCRRRVEQLAARYVSISESARDLPGRMAPSHRARRRNDQEEKRLA